MKVIEVYVYKLGDTNNGFHCLEIVHEISKLHETTSSILFS